MTTREVILDGGSPWGFRMHGGADVHQPLRISRVNPGSKASLKGIREGDLISSINGQSTKDISNSEAHALLKSAGDKLKLGLNEDGGGSPKRRSQVKTVLQETHSETIKRSTVSSTTYTVSTTNESSEPSSQIISPNNDQRPNGVEAREDVESRENGLVSQRSTLSSTDSTPTTNSSDTKGTMADCAGTSRSKRRRKGKKSRKVVEESSYRVESPKTVEVKKPQGQVVKSRSLDDEETLRITELSGSESEAAAECSAVIVEACDSDWEVTEELELEPTKTTPESIKEKRLKRREELSLYFMPAFENPRLLDAISEEGSDLSDREIKVTKKQKHVKVMSGASRTCTTQDVITRCIPKLDLVTNPIVQQGVCTFKVVQASTTPEIVHIEETSSDSQVDSEYEPESPTTSLLSPFSPDEDTFTEDAPLSSEVELLTKELELLAESSNLDTSIAGTSSHTTNNVWSTEPSSTGDGVNVLNSGTSVSVSNNECNTSSPSTSGRFKVVHVESKTSQIGSTTKTDITDTQTENSNSPATNDKSNLESTLDPSNDVCNLNDVEQTTNDASATQESNNLLEATQETMVCTTLEPTSSAINTSGISEVQVQQKMCDTEMSEHTSDAAQTPEKPDIGQDEGQKTVCGIKESDYSAVIEENILETGQQEHKKSANGYMCDVKKSDQISVAICTSIEENSGQQEAKIVEEKCIKDAEPTINLGDKDLEKAGIYVEDQSTLNVVASETEKLDDSVSLLQNVKNTDVEVSTRNQEIELATNLNTERTVSNEGVLLPPKVLDLDVSDKDHNIPTETVQSSLVVIINASEIKSNHEQLSPTEASHSTSPTVSEKCLAEALKSPLVVQAQDHNIATETTQMTPKRKPSLKIESLQNGNGSRQSSPLNGSPTKKSPKRVRFESPPKFVEVPIVEEPVPCPVEYLDSNVEQLLAVVTEQTLERVREVVGDLSKDDLSKNDFSKEDTSKDILSLPGSLDGIEFIDKSEEIAVSETKPDLEDINLADKPNQINKSLSKHTDEVILKPENVQQPTEGQEQDTYHQSGVPTKVEKYDQEIEDLLRALMSSEQLEEEAVETSELFDGNSNQTIDIPAAKSNNPFADATQVTHGAQPKNPFAVPEAKDDLPYMTEHVTKSEENILAFDNPGATDDSSLMSEHVTKSENVDLAICSPNTEPGTTKDHTQIIEVDLATTQHRTNPFEVELKTCTVEATGTQNSTFVSAPRPESPIETLSALDHKIKFLLDEQETSSMVSSIVETISSSSNTSVDQTTKFDQSQKVESQANKKDSQTLMQEITDASLKSAASFNPASLEQEKIITTDHNVEELLTSAAVADALNNNLLGLSGIKFMDDSSRETTPNLPEQDLVKKEEAFKEILFEKNTNAPSEVEAKLSNEKITEESSLFIEESDIVQTTAASESDIKLLKVKESSAETKVDVPKLHESISALEINAKTCSDTAKVKCDQHFSPQTEVTVPERKVPLSFGHGLSNSGLNTLEETSTNVCKVSQNGVNSEYKSEKIESAYFTATEKFVDVISKTLDISSNVKYEAFSSDKKRSSGNSKTVATTDKFKTTCDVCPSKPGDTLIRDQNIEALKEIGFQGSPSKSSECTAASKSGGQACKKSTASKGVTQVIPVKVEGKQNDKSNQKKAEKGVTTIIPVKLEGSKESKTVGELKIQETVLKQEKADFSKTTSTKNGRKGILKNGEPVTRIIKVELEERDKELPSPTVIQESKDTKSSKKHRLYKIVDIDLEGGPKTSCNSKELKSTDSASCVKSNLEGLENCTSSITKVTSEIISAVRNTPLQETGTLDTTNTFVESSFLDNGGFDVGAGQNCSKTRVPKTGPGESKTKIIKVSVESDFDQNKDTHYDKTKQSENGSNYDEDAQKSCFMGEKKCGEAKVLEELISCGSTSSSTETFHSTVSSLETISDTTDIKDAKEVNFIARKEIQKSASKGTKEPILKVSNKTSKGTTLQKETRHLLKETKTVVQEKIARSSPKKTILKDVEKSSPGKIVTKDARKTCPETKGTQAVQESIVLYSTKNFKETTSATKHPEVVISPSSSKEQTSKTSKTRSPKPISGETKQRSSDSTSKPGEESLKSTPSKDLAKKQVRSCEIREVRKETTTKTSKIETVKRVQSNSGKTLTPPKSPSTGSNIKAKEETMKKVAVQKHSESSDKKDRSSKTALSGKDGGSHKGNGECNKEVSKIRLDKSIKSSTTGIQNSGRSDKEDAKLDDIKKSSKKSRVLSPEVRDKTRSSPGKKESTGKGTVTYKEDQSEDTIGNGKDTVGACIKENEAGDLEKSEGRDEDPKKEHSPSMSSETSSEVSTQVTVRRNQMVSSIGDVDDLIKDMEYLKELDGRFQPANLRDLCLQKLVSLPFGEEVLEELANVSKSLEKFTNTLPARQFRIPNFALTAEKKKWFGLPSEENPGVLVCLSPTQKEFLDGKKKVAKEADKLLELHQKFLERRSCNEGGMAEAPVVALGQESERSRLLDIILEEGGVSRSQSQLDLSEARSNARDLTEWLHLARMDVNKPFANSRPRRSSLPNELYVRQMQNLIEKEKEIQRELEELEEEKRKLGAEMQRQFEPTDYRISKNGDIAIHDPKSKLRQKMYEEYMSEVAAREERKQMKVIKISLPENEGAAKQPTNEIEHEFMDKVKARMDKYGLNSDEGEESSDQEDPEKRKVLIVDDEGGVTEAKKLPKHIKEIVDMRVHDDGVWSPGQRASFNSEELKSQIGSSQESSKDKSDESIPPVWTPRSAGSSPTAERKEFRPVNFESPVLGRKARTKSDGSANLTQAEPPWKVTGSGGEVVTTPSGTFVEKRLPTSYSAPGPGFSESVSRLPKAQNPTITLLQKAREGQIPKGAAYIEQERARRKNESPFLSSSDLVYQIRTESVSDSDSERPRKINISPKKYEGIGPTTKDGMPLILRSEVRDANMSQWYKKMYDTIHKQRPTRYEDDEYVMVRYKQRRGRYPYATGYLSEPEPGAYDSDAALSDSKYATLDRRRPASTTVNNNKGNEYYMSSTLPRNSASTTTITYRPDVQHSTEIYKNQPGRIENYTPGQSSISEKEAKKWWDEVMDIFDGHLEQQKRVPQTKGFMSQALKESGYESDSTLVFRRRDDGTQQLSPLEQREVYKNIQKGGDVPLHGLRKPAPERPKESPRKYVENEVTIHYRTPVRQEVKEALSEDELARRQADAMRKIYEEERRRKYLQELHDMNSRRHTDNFIPSQKSPIPLNRYDDFMDDLSPRMKPRPRSPEPRLVARALYNFVGQTSRELTFKKGDVIYIRRQVDKNWYEGEFNAMVGLFPANYVEVVPYDGIKITPRKPHEGQARAKYNFIAQTHLELSLAKGELVVVTRRVDDNWFEGKIGGRKGIFPVSYVEVLIDPGDPPPPSSQPPVKPVASPAAHSLLLNGSSGGKESMGSHNYVPTFPTQDLGMSYRAKPVQVTGGGGSYGSLKKNHPVDQALHIDTQNEPIPYRALYKYRPQNEDELELLEGDTVYVLEKCDDGWYVGSSERTGAFGTFPGNYVERI